jgi:hypothetical protein
MARIIQCCGTPLVCSGFTNPCPHCHTDYNWAGQRLAPRAQWGEETGERLEDILAIDTTPTDQLLDSAPR